MSGLVFLVEDLSMKEFVEGWIGRQYPQLPIRCVPHEGKRDLTKSIPRKLKAWREPGARFVVIIDNDGGDCARLKEQLRDVCTEAGRPDSFVRIACQELEAWYLGDPTALAEAFPDVNVMRRMRQAKFRNPDAVPRPSDELARLVPAFQKVSGARAMAAHIDRNRNRSASFGMFATAIDTMATDFVPNGQRT